MNPQPCARCGQTFLATRSTARYCSAACRQAAHRARHNSRPEKGDPYLLTCAICAVEFLASRADAKFCSPTCRTHARRQRQGQEAPTPAPALWREGPKARQVKEAKDAGRVWDRRSWTVEW